MARQPYIPSINRKQNTGFPYPMLPIVDDNRDSSNPGFEGIHWHEDLKFLHVLSGEIEVVTTLCALLLALCRIVTPPQTARRINP